MSGKAIGYLRVSTTDQTTARQLDGVELDWIFEDQVSGSSASNRPALIQCLDYLRDGDVLHVHSIDLLARNLLDLQKLVEELTRRGVTVHFHKASPCQRWRKLTASVARRSTCISEGGHEGSRPLQGGIPGSRSG